MGDVVTVNQSLGELDAHGRGHRNLQTGPRDDRIPIDALEDRDVVAERFLGEVCEHLRIAIGSCRQSPLVVGRHAGAVVERSAVTLCDAGRGLEDVDEVCRDVSRRPLSDGRASRIVDRSDGGDNLRRRRLHRRNRLVHGHERCRHRHPFVTRSQ
jgi:hypothetical protein